jgi:4-hydroxy-3-methylbut-2-enyl diphosphate reductase
VEFAGLQPDDIVIIPAFGATTEVMQRLTARGCGTVDTTCGDVMSVWRRVREYARRGLTSIIHGKSAHEETRATASRALGDDGMGNYLIILTLADADLVCDYIRHGGNKYEFLQHFAGAYSVDFDPDLHLKRIGVANQTTMLKSETEELQSRLRQAITDHWLPALERFKPQMVFISAGFDAHREDDLGQLALVEDDYAWITRQLVDVAERHAGGRLVSCLEGGYSLSALARSVAAHLRVLADVA